MRGQPFRYVDFRGGLNVKAAPYLIGENQCRDCLNVVSTVRGSIKKRNGNLTFAQNFPASPASLTSLFPFENGTTRFLIAVGGTKIYSISTGGVIQDIGGGVPVTNNSRWEFALAAPSGGQGPMYGINGTDTPKFWSGAGSVGSWTASVGTVPNGKYITYASNRIFIAGTAANPSRLYFSDIGDPRSWTTTNVVDLDPSDGMAISGIARVGDSLLVFKPTKTYLIYDLDTGANRALSRSIGCVAPRSIAEGPDGIYFASEDQGVFVATQSRITRLSDEVQPLFDEITPSVKNLCAGVFYKDHYYLSCPYDGATTNSTTLTYDITTKSWWKHSNNAIQFALWRQAEGANLELYAAQASTPIVDKCYVDGVFQDNGANFQTFWTGPWLAFKEPYRHKRLRQVHIEGHGHVDVYHAQNFLQSLSLVKSDVFSLVSTGNHLFGDATLFGGGEIFGDQIQQGEVRIYSLGVARSFSVKFLNSDSNDVEIDAYTMMITPRAN
jgi:hypothetical protein